MPVTIRDVAKRLNLSITTVSRALDGYPDVSEVTRQRVVLAAHELGYLPNRAARQLMRKCTDTIGYILPSSASRFFDPFFAEYISAVADEAAQSNYDMLVSSAPVGGDVEQQVYQRWVCRQRVDGFVLNRVRQTDWRIRYLSEEHVPFTCLERSIDSLDYPSIHVENIESTSNLVNHLVSQGFCRIAFIGGPSDLTIQFDRFVGYCQGLTKHDIRYDPALVTQADLTSSGGYQEARQLLSLSNPPNAVICINDETAFGVLHAAHEAHISVGEGIAVAGFDGVQDLLYSQPPLTTVDQPICEIAHQLVRMLLAEINGETLPERHVVIQPILRIRDSTIKGGQK
jgi:LacI family transcriptional regulator